MFIKYLTVILAILLYALIYFLRLQQLGFEARNHANSFDLFPNVRQVLDKQIQTFLPSPQAELLSGILLGSKKDLPGELKLALRDTATLHIVVVSGQNLTLVAGFVMLLAGIFRRKVVIILALSTIIFYTFLTGGQVPVLRAAIMAILAFGAQLLGRVRDGAWILIITAGLMLIYDPFWISDISFQLSFLATLGVVMVSPIILNYLKRLPDVIKTDLAVTVSSQLLVLPIIAYNFHQISLVSIITNLAVLWTIPIIMILGAINLIISLIYQPLASMVAVLVYIPLTYFIYMVKFFASLPFAWEYIGDFDWVVWIGYYFILAGGLFVLSLNYDQKSVTK